MASSDEPSFIQSLTNAQSFGDLLVWGARALRAIHMKSFVREVRSRAALGLFIRLHNNVVHRMRALAVRMDEWEHQQIETSTLARDFCTECNILLADLLELDTNHLHCCIKVLSRGQEPNDDIVKTWIRSEPYDAREEDGLTNGYHVCDNSVWAALLGRFDGRINWEQPFACFACNDLFEHGEDYRNSRVNWRAYYRSTLVYPLRYLTYENGERRFNAIGFLAFDSPVKNAFPRAPDIYKYRSELDKRADYISRLSAIAAFQVGAVIADTLSMFLRSAYERHARRKG